MDSDKLQLLHDHYNETFSLIRDRERQRDRLFLIVIILYGLLAAAVLFSVGFGVALRSLQVAGAKVDLSALPSGAVLGALWTLALAITLRYCQASIIIERQYSYLHIVEDRISREYADSELFRREGRAYLDSYPTFSSWSWMSYTYGFPILLVLVTLALVFAEWLEIPGGWIYKILDGLIAIAICVTLALYRFTPALSRIYSRIQNRL